MVIPWIVIRYQCLFVVNDLEFHDSIGFLNVILEILISNKCVVMIKSDKEK